MVQVLFRNQSKLRKKYTYSKNIVHGIVIDTFLTNKLTGSRFNMLIKQITVYLENIFFITILEAIRK